MQGMRGDAAIVTPDNDIKLQHIEIHSPQGAVEHIYASDMKWAKTLYENLCPHKASVIPEFRLVREPMTVGPYFMGTPEEWCIAALTMPRMLTLGLKEGHKPVTPEDGRGNLHRGLVVSPATKSIKVVCAAWNEADIAKHTGTDTPYAAVYIVNGIKNYAFCKAAEQPFPKRPSVAITGLTPGYTTGDVVLVGYDALTGKLNNCNLDAETIRGYVQYRAGQRESLGRKMPAQEYGR